MTRKVTEKRMVARVIGKRNCSWSAAPCQGWLQVLEQESDGVWRHPDIPWDDSWEPGTIVEVEMIARVVKFGPKSRKRCHVPWPAHVCDDGKARNRRKARR